MNAARWLGGMSPDVLSAVERHLEAACGMTFSSSIRSTLALSLQNAANAEQLTRDTFVARLLEGDPHCTRALIESCTIKETYFFRHPEHFRALREFIFPKLVELQPLSVWSAACATGEEPYSLAMCALLSGLPKTRITATDVSELALSAAREGVYTPWSLRRAPQLESAAYLETKGEELHVRSRVREMVEFHRSNLVTEEAPERAYHVVFCRNVLIYFSPETAAAVMKKLWHSLLPGGFLVLGAVELNAATGLAAEWFEHRDATFLRKPTAPLEQGAVRDAGFPTRLTTLPRPKPRLEAVRQPPARVSVVPAAAAPVGARDGATQTEAGGSAYARAREAARRGDLLMAESLAEQAAHASIPPAYLILGMVRELRGDLAGAVEALRKALYLDPTLAMAHATLATLLSRLGKRAEAKQARANALRLLQGLEDHVQLEAVDSITAHALRRALQQGQELL